MFSQQTQIQGSIIQHISTAPTSFIQEELAVHCDLPLLSPALGFWQILDIFFFFITAPIDPELCLKRELEMCGSPLVTPLPQLVSCPESTGYTDSCQ